MKRHQQSRAKKKKKKDEDEARASLRGRPYIHHNPVKLFWLLTLTTF